jgi:hypothetical protein
MPRRPQLLLPLGIYLAVALSSMAFAQLRCPCIMGTIVAAETDEPLADLTVRLVDIDGVQLNQVDDASQALNVTDGDGRFVLEVSGLTIDALLSDSYFLEVYEGGVEGILRFREFINLGKKATDISLDTEEVELEPIAIP